MILSQSQGECPKKFSFLSKMLLRSLLFVLVCAQNSTVSDCNPKCLNGFGCLNDKCVQMALNCNSFPCQGDSICIDNQCKMPQVAVKDITNEATNQVTRFLIIVYSVIGVVLLLTGICMCGCGWIYLKRQRKRKELEQQQFQLYQLQKQSL